MNQDPLQAQGKTLGKQLLVELSGCHGGMLDSTALVERCLVEAVREAKATVVQTVFHRFSPYGVSGVVVIAESHVAIHTWPEHGYAAVDIFTCSEQIDPYSIMKSLARKFSARQHTATLIHRGPHPMPQVAASAARHKF